VPNSLIAKRRCVLYDMYAYVFVLYFIMYYILLPSGVINDDNDYDGDKVRFHLLEDLRCFFCGCLSSATLFGDVTGSEVFRQRSCFLCVLLRQKSRFSCVSNLWLFSVDFATFCCPRLPVEQQTRVIVFEHLVARLSTGDCNGFNPSCCTVECDIVQVVHTPLLGGVAQLLECRSLTGELSLIYT